MTTSGELARHRHPGDPLPPLRARVDATLQDAELRGAFRVMAQRFNEARRVAMAPPGMAALKADGTRIRAEGVRALPANLARAEASLRRLGVHVHHATTGPDAAELIATLAVGAGASRAVKAKSMATEEIDLNEHLERHGIEVFETDLGEWIVQKADERPSHIIAPAVHKTRPQVTRLFSRLAGRDLPDQREELCAFAQQRLREVFLTADLGISGANFVCADTGTIVLVTNEGNGRLTTSLPRVHIALVPVEKVLARFADLATMLPLLIRNATGQKLTSYVTMINGPRRAGELDGPDEVHVVFLDAGRTALLGTPFEDMLRCIRCGACLNVCPVYGTIGGHAYGGVYPGPMGAVLTPLLSRMRDGTDLPEATSLCGACSEVCPVGIPLHDLLLELRAAVAGSPRTRSLGRRAFFAVWSRAWSRPRLYRGSARVATVARRYPRWARHLPLARAWHEGRELPPPVGETFHAWWRRARAPAR
ncbi:MAG TPA: lactate utilization protein B [Acidimicrobiia bacterium]|nr:lactate utilization protein B [Acidimicrobiia bacterium]